MGDEASGGEAYLYVISCGLKRAKIGVAGYASSTDPLLSSLSSFRQNATAAGARRRSRGLFGVVEGARSIGARLARRSGQSTHPLSQSDPGSASRSGLALEHLEPLNHWRDI